MATLTATAAAAGAQAIYGISGVIQRFITFNPNGTAFSAGDVLQMCKIPAGARITNLIVNCSASVQSYTTMIGDGLSAGRYFASQSLVNVQTVNFLPVAGANSFPANFGYSYSVDDTVDIVFSTVTSGTAANCDIRMFLEYTCQGNET